MKTREQDFHLQFASTYRSGRGFMLY